MSIPYDNYLNDHRTNVQRAYSWMMNNLDTARAAMQDWNSEIHIVDHDASKSSMAEYDAYDRYFYGSRSAKAVKDFNRAWLHHIHHNKHHWQHWVLLEDDPESQTPYRALEMPKAMVVEMICDWWSFSWRSGNLSEIFDWYKNHKEKMILHPNTRKLVDEILAEMKDKLVTQTAN